MCKVEQNFRIKIKQLHRPRMNSSSVSTDISRTLLKWKDFLYYVQFFLSLFLSAFSFENNSDSQGSNETKESGVGGRGGYLFNSSLPSPRALAGQLLQRGHLSTWRAAGLEPVIFNIRAQVSNH